MKVQCEQLADLELHASISRGGGHAPTINLYAGQASSDQLVFCVSLSCDQAEKLCEQLFGAIELVEEEAAEATGATRQ